ncbi:MAG: hypothetical protein RLZZ28_815 [Bacteroidota bacterium]|jgi:hypothetical protein
MLRKILGLFAAYAIFVISSLALFKFSGQDPHAQAATGFQILSAVYGAFFSFLSGYVLQLIARVKKLSYLLAFIIGGFAAFSFFQSAGSHWTQLLAIFIFAPVAILGGNFYHRQGVQ